MGFARQRDFSASSRAHPHRAPLRLDLRLKSARPHRPSPWSKSRGVGDYSQAKGPRGLEAPNGNSTSPRASTPKGTRLLRISAKGVHGGTVIFTVSVQLGVPVAHT